MKGKAGMDISLKYLMAVVLLLPTVALGQTDAQQTPPSKNGAAQTTGGDPKAQFRNFYEVLDDLVADFEFDIKNGEVHGLRDIAVRNIGTSENIPPSFRAHIELAISEKILKNSKAKVIQCLPCRSKKTSVTGDSVVISSPDTNPVEMSRIAKMAGISNFMDIAFSYHPTGMLLSLYISDPETGTAVWSKTYNSETSRASAFRRGVDYSQVEDIRKQSEYKPMLQHRIILGWLFEKDVKSYSGCIIAGYRLMERYDNRKKEVGFELDYIRNVTSLISTATTATSATTSSTTSSSTASATTLWTGFNATMLFVHGWNFLGEEENYNKVRGHFFAGIGGSYSSGYIGGLIRSGFEWRMAKHWAITAIGGYRPQATAFLPNTSTELGKISGVEFGVGVNALF